MLNTAASWQISSLSLPMLLPQPLASTGSTNNGSRLIEFQFQNFQLHFTARVDIISPIWLHFDLISILSNWYFGRRSLIQSQSQSQSNFGCLLWRLRDLRFTIAHPLLGTRHCAFFPSFSQHAPIHLEAICGDLWFVCLIGNLLHKFPIIMENKYSCESLLNKNNAKSLKYFPYFLIFPFFFFNLSQ